MTKLTCAERTQCAEFTKSFKLNQGAGFFYDEFALMTVAICPNDNMSGFARVYVAYCAPTEKKFSKKRGRLTIAKRVYAHNYILVPDDNYEAIADFFFNLR